MTTDGGDRAMARRRKGDPVHGWVVLDKPLGMTSTRAVAVVKRMFNARKAGHGGTLDPLATGILPIALGEATKTVQFAMDGEKVYRFTVRWGRETDTDDAEGEVVEVAAARPGAPEIEAALAGFVGTVLQVPPRFSAIKVDGERAYDLARDGEEVTLEARPVEIDRLVLVDRPDDDHAVLDAQCGRGTYVRALARDLGRALGCLGHVSALRRMQVGPFTQADSISLEDLEVLSHKDAGREALMDVLRPVETALDDIPALAVNGTEAARLKRGQPVIMRGRDAPVLHGTIFVEFRGSPVALAEVSEGALKPKRVFNMT